MKHLLALAFLALLASCVAVKPQPRLASFVDAEYAPYAQPGTGSIDGQAFLKTRSGDVKFGAGCEVSMNPVTSYSTEWYERLVIGYVHLEPPDPRSNPFNRKTIADGSGNFLFEGLAPGDYYLSCRITWEVPSG